MQMHMPILILQEGIVKMVGLILFDDGLPCYAEPRELLGIRFDDPDYPSHYTVPAPSRFLKPEEYEVIVTAIKSSLARL